MNIAYSVFMSILFFCALPMVLGQIWKGILDNGGVVFTYLSGFITIWAIFELLGVPMVFMYVPVHVQVWVFSAVFIVLCVYIVYRERASLVCWRDSLRSMSGKVKQYSAGYSLYEWIYLAVLVGVLGLQLYYAIFYDVGNWRSDDGTYVVISSSAIYDDAFYRTDVVSGVFSGSDSLINKYGLCSLYVFYAYAAVVTGLGVAVVEQTVCAALFLLMAYGCFFLLSILCFPDDKERDNRMIFLIFVAVAFIFGYHSRYSLSFRLLGAIWQGKAVLATVITPFILAVFPRMLERGVSKKKLLLSIAISLSAISLTLGGVIVMGVIPGIIALLFIIRTRRVKPLVYLLVMLVFPVINMLLYLIHK